MTTAARRRPLSALGPPPARAKPLPRQSSRRVRMRTQEGGILAFTVGDVLDIRGLSGLIVGEYVVERVTPGFGATSTSLSIRLKAVVPKPEAKPKRAAKPARRPVKAPR